MRPLIVLGTAFFFHLLLLSSCENRKKDDPKPLTELQLEYFEPQESSVVEEGETFRVRVKITDADDLHEHGFRIRWVKKDSIVYDGGIKHLHDKEVNINEEVNLPKGTVGKMDLVVLVSDHLGTIYYDTLTFYHGQKE